MTITLKTLRQMNVCDPALVAFARAFPSGAETWMEIAFHPECEPEWRGWIAIYAPGLSPAERGMVRQLAREADQ